MEPITITFPGFKKLLNPDVPPSTDSVIVFPFNRTNKRFNKEFYSSEMTNGRASSDDINQVLTILELISPRFPTKLDLLISCLVRFVPPLVIVILFEQTDVFQSSACVWAVLLIYWIVGIFFLLSQRDLKADDARVDLERIIEMVQPEYLKKGLRWQIPEQNYHWIELVNEPGETELLDKLTVDESGENEVVNKLVVNESNENEVKLIVNEFGENEDSHYVPL